MGSLLVLLMEIPLQTWSIGTNGTPARRPHRGLSQSSTHKEPRNGRTLPRFCMLCHNDCCEPSGGQDGQELEALDPQKLT